MIEVFVVFKIEINYLTSANKYLITKRSYFTDVDVVET